MIQAKNDVILEAGWVDKNDVTWGKVDSTVVPPDQKSKQSKVTN
jgi:hypothetical protein